jgi:hypothetical protein
MCEGRSLVSEARHIQQGERHEPSMAATGLADPLKVMRGRVEARPS